MLRSGATKVSAPSWGAEAGACPFAEATLEGLGDGFFAPTAWALVIYIFFFPLRFLNALLPWNRFQHVGSNFDRQVLTVHR